MSTATTAPAVPVDPALKQLRWAWPVAIVLGFPAGGLVADLAVDGVSSVGSALAGGLIAGSVSGAAEWIALRRLIFRIWIPATAIGMAAGLAAGAAVVDYGIDRKDVVLIGAVTGAAVGSMQALVLAKRRVPHAYLWALANPPAWALGWLITSYVISTNVKEQFTNFGAGGAIVFGVLTGLLLNWLLQQRK
jgi:hypothetical protein